MNDAVQPDAAEPSSSTSRRRPPDTRGGLQRQLDEAHNAGPSHAEAFAGFYRSSAPRLVAFLRWQGASLPDAAECAQEALTEAFQKWHLIHEPHAWCRTVASRCYARRVGTVEDPVDDIEAISGGPLLASNVDFDRIEQSHHVLRLLDLLPARQRQVMAWTYDGVAPTEIADALQITPEAVRSNLYKARMTLRYHLAQQADFEADGQRGEKDAR
jgi:RNA polymerase sigma factor (sigma-70 family)